MRMCKEEYYKILEKAIDDFKRENGASPTVYELETETGIPRATLARYLQRMRAEGILSYNGHRGLITGNDRRLSEPVVRVPILGNVACGIPKFAEENIEDYVLLPEKLFGPGEFFFLRANGESMINAGIGPGDLVLIRKQDRAETGEIVVALIDDENATLKRYRPDAEKQCIELVPENPLFDTITVDPVEHDFRIQGVAVKVIRDIQ